MRLHWLGRRGTCGRVASASGRTPEGRPTLACQVVCFTLLLLDGMSENSARFAVHRHPVAAIQSFHDHSGFLPVVRAAVLADQARHLVGLKFRRGYLDGNSVPWGGLVRPPDRPTHQG